MGNDHGETCSVCFFKCEIPPKTCLPLFVATLSSFFSLAFFILNANGTQETSLCVESESKNEEEKGFNFWRSHENPIKPLHKETSSAFTRRPHACGNLSNFNYFGINLGSWGSVCGALLRESEQSQGKEEEWRSHWYLVLQVWQRPHSCCIYCNKEWGQVLKTVKTLRTLANIICDALK